MTKSPDGSRVAVIVPTYGRPELLMRTMERLKSQTLRPDILIVSAPDESHVARLDAPEMPIRYVFGTLGAAAQRNAALSLVLESDPLEPFDVIVFFDDDFLPADDFLENTVAAFADHPDCVVLTGRVLADGINSNGISYEAAQSILAASPPVPVSEGEASDYHAGYGCNMAVRVSAIGAERFDERLVLYGWQEDADFTRRVAAGRGRILRHSALRGVHMGIKSGRTSGVRFGYSQIVNPVYLMRKGSLTPKLALRLMARNVIANASRALWAEPWIDRRGRLWGNVIGLSHVLGGRIEPEHARELA